MKTTTLGMVLFFLTTVIYFSKTRDLKQELAAVMNEKQLNDSLCMRHSEKLLNHVLINLQLNAICDKYQSSRNEKRKNKELLNLMRVVN